MMTDLERKLEAHYQACKLESNCRLCWDYGLYLLRNQQRSSNRALATLWVAAGLLYFAALLTWLWRIA